MSSVQQCSMVWRDLEVLLAVHRAGSHRGAGKALGVDPTTVGRRVSALEESVGARLFDRTPVGLVLTAAGRSILPRAERVEAEMVAAARELEGADERVEGTIRLTAPDGFVQHILVPALPSLRREQPALEIELRVDARVLDLSRREADVAVRLSRPKEPSLVARRVGTMELGLFAARSYVEQRGAPRSTRELSTHDFVGFDASFDRLPQQRWFRRLVPAPRYALRANLTTTQVAAAIAGLGIALVPTFVASSEPRLVRVLPKIGGPEREIWAVSHVDLRKNARVSRMTAWLARLLASA